MKIHNGGGDISTQEDVEILEYRYDQIPDLLISGEIIDAKTIILTMGDDEVGVMKNAN
ncbi:MAG: hypothetical protein IPN86_04880 [Saprospiraceae bacterium]|nr:hypothetical protein [Saprospiraceae bacterium]